mgnify:CR=1 FL=1
MKTPRRTEPLSAPLRDDDGRLLSSPAVCPSCRCRPVRVVAYTNEQGAKAYRSSTSCEECQRAAFGGGSPPAAPAAVVVPSALPATVVTVDECAKLVAEIRALAATPSPGSVHVDSLNSAVLRASAHPVSHDGVGYDSLEVVRVLDAAPISETRPAPRPITPLTTGETVAALCQSLATVPAPAPVTSHDLERHAVRMRRAGLAPVTRETCDPHERRFFSVGGGR